MSRFMEDTIKTMYSCDILNTTIPSFVSRSNVLRKNITQNTFRSIIYVAYGGRRNV